LRPAPGALDLIDALVRRPVSIRLSCAPGEPRELRCLATSSSTVEPAFRAAGAPRILEE